MVLADSSYPLLDAMWTMIVFFAWVIWFWMLITIFADLFRRSDVSGWGKAGWVVLLLVLPFVGVLIYLIGQGRGMAERRGREAQTAQTQFDSYVRSVATDGHAADQIAKGKQLFDSGAITAEEYESLKQKVLT
ncbi:MAG TPA: SHOCT domain-containing protein [Micromonosporaceae bacterium]